MGHIRGVRVGAFNLTARFLGSFAFTEGAIPLPLIFEPSGSPYSQGPSALKPLSILFQANHCGLGGIRTPDSTAAV